MGDQSRWVKIHSLHIHAQTKKLSITLNDLSVPIAQNVRRSDLHLVNLGNPYPRTERIASSTRRLRLLLTSKHVHLKNEILLSKLLLHPTTVSILRGSAKPSNINY